MLTVVGFVICLSCIGIMYGNLTSVTDERDAMVNARIQMKRDTEETRLSMIHLKSKIDNLEETLISAQGQIVSYKSEINSLNNMENERKSELENTRSELSSAQATISSLEGSYKRLDYEKTDCLQASSALSARIITLSGKEEEADSCRGTVSDLQIQLSAQSARMVLIEDELKSCKKSVEEQEQKIQDGDGGEEVGAIAAAPVPLDDTNKEPEVNVADIPDLGQGNKPIDNLQNIPEALAPAPGGAAAEAPVLPVQDGEAVAAVPVPREQPVGQAPPLADGGAPALPQPVAGEDGVNQFWNDAENPAGNGGPVQVNHDPDNIMPAQPAPVQPLVGEAQQQQIQDLQDRQANIMPEPLIDAVDAVLHENDVGAQPPPAQPAQPIGHDL